MKYLFSLLAFCLLSCSSGAVTEVGSPSAPSSAWTRIGRDGPWMAWDAERRVACYTRTVPSTSNYYRDAGLACVHVPRGTEP